MQVLITGGAGFVGSHLTDHFLAHGHDVRVFDNFATGRRENIAHLAGKKRFELIEGDLRQPEQVAAACKGVDVISHQAAIPSVPRSVADPALTHDVNVNGTFNLLMAARDAGVRRVVYAASSSAYGDVEVSPKVETLRPRPKSPYAVHKLLGEYYMKVFNDQFGVQAVSLRYFNVFGPRQDPKSQYAAVVPAFLTNMLAGKSPLIYGDGLQSRDFTFIENVKQANYLAATVDAVNGESVNIACGASVTLLEMVAVINKMLGTQIKPRHDPERAGDVKHSLADITAARELLGYAPVVEFEEGLKRSLDYYRSAKA
ncbi:MAG: UDP-N-acetylglucosamine 4-epimerase [Phycisphaerae bacterium]|nr:UDP-N-acetylglucosamine 4-epimerase [Phycisphaerae bacterium]